MLSSLFLINFVNFVLRCLSLLKKKKKKKRNHQSLGLGWDGGEGLSAARKRKNSSDVHVPNVMRSGSPCIFKPYTLNWHMHICLDHETIHLLNHGESLNMPYVI